MLTSLTGSHNIAKVVRASSIAPSFHSQENLFFHSNQGFISIPYVLSGKFKPFQLRYSKGQLTMMPRRSFHVTEFVSKE